MFVVPCCEWLSSSDSRWGVLIFPSLELGAVQNEMCFCVIYLFMPFLFPLSFFEVGAGVFVKNFSTRGMPALGKQSTVLLKDRNTFEKIPSGGRL